MTVSRRNTIFAGAAVAALITLGGAAYAGGMNGSAGGATPCSGGCGGGGGSTVIPGAGVGGHGVTFGGGNSHGGSGGGSACCGGAPKGHGVMIPGVNVAGPNVMVGGTNVTVNQGSVISNTQTFLNTSVAGGNQGAFIVSGGGGYYAPQGIAPSSVGALNVAGNEETYFETITEQVPSTEEFCADQVSVSKTLRAVQAVCLDDKGTPHPASQVDAGQRISASFSGEVFRCMAGTNMQVTLGSVEGNGASFAHGETFSCAKGEALVHRGGGNLACAPQAPQRSCNERSLLRRNGPGIKIVEAQVQTKTCVPQTRTVMKSVQRQVERVRQVKGQPMVFDGGVGQGVY